MMKITATAVLLASLLAPLAYAQTPSVSATCTDGSTFTGTTRSGACRGHQGVASWNTAAATPTTAASPGIAPAAAPPNRSTTATPAAPPASIPNRVATNANGASGATAGKLGGGPGQVWVNSSSKVYHCQGDRYYGKTKSGEFMSLSAAQAAGDRPAGGKACSS